MITSLSEDIANTNRRTSLQDYEIVHTKLDEFINKVNQKIVSRIQLVKQVYLDDYKEQVSQMSNQLRIIRGVLDEQLLKQRSNQRLFYLQEQRDFFRAQVIKLNADLKKSGQENQKIKTQLSETKQQCDNLRKIVYDLETRIFKLTYENIEIQKMKQQGKTAHASTNNWSTPTKALNSGRENKKRNIQEKEKDSEKYRTERTDRENENESIAQPRLEKQKTHYSLRKLKPSYSLAVTMTNLAMSNKMTEPSSREQILDRCIKELKKQIHYRNLNVKQQNKVSFDGDEKVNFDKFTKSDKKQLVYRFMSNPQILEQFYKFIFQKQKKTNQGETSELGALDKIALAKGMDSRHNTKMLQSFKAQFDKRIYDIKANRY